MKYRICSIGWLLCVASAMFAASAVGAEFALVKDGVACAEFKLETMDKKAAESAEKDVALFNSHLKKVTGAELPMATDDSSNNLIVIDLKPIDAIDTRFNWRIAFPKDSEMRVEATTTSLFTALRQLIEEGCDARFLGTERCMFQFEPRKDVSVSIRERKNAKANYTLLRDIYGTKGHRRELGITDDGLFKYSHGIPIYAFPGDYYNSKGWPEAVMPVRKGKKLVHPGSSLYSGWQPCYSNPETARIAIENIRDYLKKHPDTLSITLGINDTNSDMFCECDECTKMDKDAEKSVFSNDPQNRSASYYTFVNRIAEALAPDYPNLRIGLLAYAGTIMPPKFKVHPSVVPMMTYDTHSAYMDAAVRKRQDDVIRRWGEMVRETGIWDYSWGGGYYIPRVDFKGRAERIKFLYANGGRAYFGENSMPDALDGPKTYLVSRLLENVEADTDDILDEWFTRFAGKAAAAPLRKLYKLSAAYWHSSEMKKSALWSSREYIYSYPYDNQFYALTPGFTESLLKLAQEVRSRAKTDGEKARAEVLLRHFERLDCMAAFKGIAYMAPDSAELKSAKDAVRMLDEFARRSEALFSAWERVRHYFIEAPDFDAKDVYGSANAYLAVPLLAEQFGKAAAFMDDPSVIASLKRIEQIAAIPQEIREMLKNITSLTIENSFANIGLSKPLDTMKIKTTLAYDAVEDSSFEGGMAIRIWPGRFDGAPDPEDLVLREVSAFTITHDVKPGMWLVTMKVRTNAKAAQGDLAVWRQTDGNDKDWEGWHPVAIKKGVPHTFVQVRSVTDMDDGLNIKLRVKGFGKDEPLHVGDIKLMRLGTSGKSGRSASVSPNRLTPREGSVHEKVRGEDALVNRNPDAYTIAHIVMNVPRILPDEKLLFTVRSTLPEGAATGQFGAIIYEQSKGDWQQKQNILWNRRPSSAGWEDVSFGLTGEQLGKKSGLYLLIFFKMRGTDAVALSQLSWRVE